MLNEIEKRSKEKIPNLEIYTDGSCKSLGQNMKFGGWAFIATRDGKISEWSWMQFAGLQNMRHKIAASMKKLLFIVILPMQLIVIYKNGT